MKTQLFDFAENVFLDESSAYTWEQLVETEFLERLMRSLKEEMGKEFFYYKFYIFSHFKLDVLPSSITSVDKNNILIYISDELASIPTHLMKHYHAIFKSYLPHEVKGNIFSFGLGYTNGVHRFDSTPAMERPINVFFSGFLHNTRFPLYVALHPYLKYFPKFFTKIITNIPFKSKWRKLLRMDFSNTTRHGKNYIKFTNGFMKGVSAREYGNLLSKSKIVLCPRGGYSPETFRHLEAIRAGAIVISEQLPDTYFYRGAPFLCFKNWNDGLREVDRILSNPRELQQLQRKSIEWYESVCSEIGAARYMKEKIEEIDKGQKSDKNI